jgi:DNA segregation ATPase FtsK/SpoIIIE-like protein
VGRGLGVHIIGATQKPTADLLGSVLKSNFPVRAVGRVVSADDAKVAAGKYHTGAEALPGLGSFLFVNGDTHRVQAYHAADGEHERLIGMIAQRWDNARPHYRLDMDKQPARGDVQAKPYQPPMVGNVKLTRRVYTTFAEYYDSETGDLSYGGMAAMIRACFGDDSPTGGNYRQQAQKVVDYLKTTTTTAKIATD